MPATHTPRTPQNLISIGKWRFQTDSVEKLPLENGMRLKIPHKEKEEAFHFLTGPAGLFGPFSLLSTPALPPSAIDVGGWP